jgi:transcription initiation factor IIE alpha subunit
LENDRVKVGEEEVYRFILNQIDSVPQMEALLLVWESRPKKWIESELAERLYIGVDIVRNIMQELVRRRLLVSDTQGARQYFYESKSEELDGLIEAVAATYRRDLVRVSTFIHTKTSSAVRDFAKAFKFTKERD